MATEQNGTLLNESYLLTQVVDKYMIRRMISNKKYYPAYLTIAGDVWRYLFKNTIFSTQSEWAELKSCTSDNFVSHHNPEHLYYIDVPKGMNRLFSVCETDSCGNIVPLFYNNFLNIVKKPTKRKCKCKECDCDSELCDDANSVTKTTKLLFTINGVDYYETIYIKLCKNGDIIQYTITPTKKYNTFAGDGGDFNDDFNNDYLIGQPPFTDFEIVYVEHQKILCKLEVKECGCPKGTEDNVQKFETACCGFLNACNWRKRKCCETVLGDVNDNGRGHIKMSECGTKIYYKPTKHFHLDCDDKGRHLPKFLLVNYQATGQSCNSSVIVPEYALEACFSGIDYFSKMYNNAFSPVEKQQAKWRWTEEQNQVILFLNPLNLQELANVQDEPILF